MKNLWEAVLQQVEDFFILIHTVRLNLAHFHLILTETLGIVRYKKHYSHHFLIKYKQKIIRGASMSEDALYFSMRMKSNHC